MKSFWGIVALVTLLPASAALGKNLPIYVTPYYDSDPLSVQAGEFSDGLRSSDPEAFEGTIRAMQDSWATLRVVPMYIAAIRLYDRGERDRAVYWFYAAQHRARVFQGILDPEQVRRIGSPAFELTHAHDAFFRLAGEWINGYAFCDKDSLTQTLKKVVGDSKDVPRFADAYPDVTFIDRSGWSASSGAVSRGLEDLIRSLDTDYGRIKAKRDEAGVTKRFCRAATPQTP
jgi:hypothetical protein